MLGRRRPPLPSAEHGVDSRIEAISGDLIQVTQAVLNRDWARAKGTALITGASSAIGADWCQQPIVHSWATWQADGEAVAILGSPAALRWPGRICTYMRAYASTSMGAAPT